MTLPEVLHEVTRLLSEQHGSVTIARGHQAPLDAYSSSFQLKITAYLEEYGITWTQCEARSWLGGQWSTWRAHRGWLSNIGFDFHDVLATDWRVLHGPVDSQETAC